MLPYDALSPWTNASKMTLTRLLQQHSFATFLQFEDEFQVDFFSRILDSILFFPFLSRSFFSSIFTDNKLYMQFFTDDRTICGYSIHILTAIWWCCCCWCFSFDSEFIELIWILWQKRRARGHRLLFSILPFKFHCFKSKHLQIMTHLTNKQVDMICFYYRI